jgi:thiol-disulfide isomerase/thioredoxin
MKHRLNILVLILTFISCKNTSEKKTEEILKNKPKQIVLISKYAPERYKHFIKKDSIGEQSDKESGPYSPIESPSFTYFDSQNNISNWKPTVNEIDTLTIPYYRDYLELTTRNTYTSVPNSYLIKNGDTIVIEYVNKMPIAKITNRKVNDIELNYNNFRLKELFDNKYSSHHKIFLGWLLSQEKSLEETSIDFYQQAIKDGEREMFFLDSLHKEKLISSDDYIYRKEVLNGLLEKHKNLKPLKKWIEKNESFSNRENIETIYNLDLSKTDSLMTFSYFRDYLNNISKYDLSFIQENNVNSGAFYIDSRVRFDSISNDKKFNQTAKNYLLINAYNGIGQNFKVKDKEKYFNKLIENTTNPEKINDLQKKYKLDFSKSDKLILTTLDNDNLTFSDLLKNKKGKWLYVDFWASWCKPCRETMPKSLALKRELEKENIEFIYLSLNDKKEKWKSAIESDGISKSSNYFIENGNTSKVIEDLGIKTIPHYLIYNPKGELVNGFANRPGEGAKEQLKKLIIEK